jgi:hypothetical protein
MRRYRHAEYRTKVSEKLRFFMVFFYSRSATFQEKGIFDTKVADCYESVVSIVALRIIWRKNLGDKWRKR